MDARQPQKTTPGPRCRVLKQVKIEDTRMTSEIAEILMGSEVASHREFIYEHADKAEIDTQAYSEEKIITWLKRY